MRMTSWTRWASLLALACGACANRARPVSTVTPRIAVAVPESPTAKPSVPASTYAVVAVIASDESSRIAHVQLVDLGDRVVLVDDVPVAQSIAGGPLVAARELAKGLPVKEEGMVHGLAGTYPDSVFAIYGAPPTRGSPPSGRAFQLTAKGWRAVPGFSFGTTKNSYSYAQEMFATGDKSAVFVEHVASSLDDDVSVRLWSFAKGARPTKQVGKLHHGSAAASRDGHVWVEGWTANRGTWLLHAEGNRKPTLELIPDSDSCDENASTSIGLVAGAGGTLTVRFQSTGGCERIEGNRVLVRDAAGWRSAGELPIDAELVAVDAHGTLWTRQGEELVAQDRDGRTTTQQLPTFDPEAFGLATPKLHGMRCRDVRMLVRSDDERWLQRSCGSDLVSFDIVFREHAKQAPIVIRRAE